MFGDGIASAPQNWVVKRIRGSFVRFEAVSASRLLDLDRAKGLAILLVVFGHLVARDEPSGLGWYEPLRIAIYLFHMPFFMYLSGYAAFRFASSQTSLRRWPGLVGRRASRLLVPFLLFGVVILLAKLTVARFATVDNVPPDLWEGLRALVWDTDHSPATSVWYVVVLFVYAIVTPLLLAAARGRLALLVGVAVAVFLLPGLPVLYLDRICRYFVFFVAGGLAARAGAPWLAFIDRWRWPALAALALLAGFVASGQVTFEWDEVLIAGPYKWYMLAAGLLSMPALHGLVRHPTAAGIWGLEVLGRYCFVIYLLNTIMIGLSKAVLLRMVAWDAANFLWLAIVFMVVATLGPILVKRMLLVHVPALNRMTD